MFILREASESVLGAAAGRASPAFAGGKVPAGERGAPGRRARETLARLAKKEHLFSRKLKSIGRRFTHRMKARRVRILVSMTKNRSPTKQRRSESKVDWEFLLRSPECGLDELSHDM